MKAVKKDFGRRDEDEQDILLSETWCSRCEEPVVTLDELEEYENNGFIFIEGKCPKCGESVCATIEKVRFVSE